MAGWRQSAGAAFGLCTWGAFHGDSVNPTNHLLLARRKGHCDESWDFV